MQDVLRLVGGLPLGSVSYSSKSDFPPRPYKWATLCHPHSDPPPPFFCMELVASVMNIQKLNPEMFGQKQGGTEEGHTQRSDTPHPSELRYFWRSATLTTTHDDDDYDDNRKRLIT